jgi:hypothetical protein
MHYGLREVIRQTDSIYIASSSVLSELFVWSLLKDSDQIDRLSRHLDENGDKEETKKIFQQ